MKRIFLTKGYAALVDDSDYGYLSGFKWLASINKTGQVYAKRIVRCVDGKRRNFYMHGCVLGYPIGKVDRCNPAPYQKGTALNPFSRPLKRKPPGWWLRQARCLDSSVESEILAKSLASKCSEGEPQRQESDQKLDRQEPDCSPEPSSLSAEQTQAAEEWRAMELREQRLLLGEVGESERP